MVTAWRPRAPCVTSRQRSPSVHDVQRLLPVVLPRALAAARRTPAPSRSARRARRSQQQRAGITRPIEPPGRLRWFRDSTRRGPASSTRAGFTTSRTSSSSASRILRCGGDFTTRSRGKSYSRASRPRNDLTWGRRLVLSVIRPFSNRKRAAPHVVQPSGRRRRPRTSSGGSPRSGRPRVSCQRIRTFVPCRTTSGVRSCGRWDPCLRRKPSRKKNSTDRSTRGGKRALMWHRSSCSSRNIRMTSETAQSA